MIKKIILFTAIILPCFNGLFSQPSYPTGVFCSCGPTTGIGNGSVAPNIAKLDFVKGILVRMSWELCEPQDGNYNWTYLDGQLEAAKNYGKKISVAIGNGMGAPQWLYSAGVQRIISEVPYKDTIPVPWDEKFLEKWSDFIAALGKRYKNDTTIVLVYVTNSSGNGYEMQLPFKTTPSLAELGYSDEKMIQSWKRCITVFADAFPNHIITNDFHPVNNSNKIADSVYNYAKSTYGRRYGANAWWWTQKNTTVYPAQYEILKKSAASNMFAGVQMAYSHTRDSSKFGVGGMPAALDMAMNNGIFYWEFWNEDLLNTKFDSLFRSVTDLKKADTTQSSSLITEKIIGPVSGKEITFAVYLPPGFQELSDSLPVIYNLHGIGGNYLSGTKNVVQSYEEALEKGIIQPMIIVFPDGMNDSFWADSKDSSRMVETNVIKEIIPFIETKYKTKTGRCNRVIQGFSMGGAGAVEYAAKYPDVFSICINYDGAVGAIRDWKSISTYHPAIAQSMFGNDSVYFRDFCLWDNLSKHLVYIKDDVKFKFSVGALKDGNEELKKFFDNYHINLDFYQSQCDHNFTCLLEENGEENWKFIQKNKGCTATKVYENCSKNVPSVYPNPATDYIEINLGVIHEPKQSGDQRSSLPLQIMRIFNTLGECVIYVETGLRPVSGEDSEPVQRIDVSQLPAGVYFLRLGNSVEKFVILK
jgi:S-formylglutathione hydrolase FrmB